MKTIKFLSAIALVSVLAVSCKETPKTEEAETIVEDVIEVTTDGATTVVDETIVAVDSTGAVIEEVIETVIDSTGAVIEETAIEVKKQ